jgi:hypothetical protein
VVSYERETSKELADELGIRVERIYKWSSSQIKKHEQLFRLIASQTQISEQL